MPDLTEIPSAQAFEKIETRSAKQTAHRRARGSKGHRSTTRELEQKQMEECISNCLASARCCSELIAHCLSRGGEHASAEHLGALLGCASICDTSAKLMIFQSPFHANSCGVCADVCLRCAEDCERIGANDEQMCQCAELCRLCAESCEIMAGMN